MNKQITTDFHHCFVYLFTYLLTYFREGQPSWTPLFRGANWPVPCDRKLVNVFVSVRETLRRLTSSTDVRVRDYLYMLDHTQPCWRKSELSEL